MKKKIFVCLIIGMVVSLSSAWALGCSNAFFISKSTKEMFDAIDARSIVRSIIGQSVEVYPVQKLSEEEFSLIENALERYDLQSDEVYYVSVATSYRVIALIVRIDSVSRDGRYFYSWKGAVGSQL